MSTTTQTFPARERRVSFAVVAAIVVSLGLGAVGGSVITRALDSADAATVAPAATGMGRAGGTLEAAAMQRP